jgi:hypothetical protein
LKLKERPAYPELLQQMKAGSITPETRRAIHPTAPSSIYLAEKIQKSLHQWTRP